MTPSSILILSAYPPGVHQISIEKALRQRGHAVFTAGSTRDVLADLEAALKRWDPEYRYDLIVRPDERLVDVLARCPFAPDLILFLESGIPFLPPDIAEAPCPTIAQFSEDLLHADWYAQLFPYFDLTLCTWKSTEIGWQRQMNRGGWAYSKEDRNSYFDLVAYSADGQYVRLRPGDWIEADVTIRGIRSRAMLGNTEYRRRIMR